MMLSFQVESAMIGMSRGVSLTARLPLASQYEARWGFSVVARTEGG